MTGWGGGSSLAWGGLSEVEVPPPLPYRGLLHFSLHFHASCFIRSGFHILKPNCPLLFVDLKVFMHHRWPEIIRRATNATVDKRERIGREAFEAEGPRGRRTSRRTGRGASPSSRSPAGSFRTWSPKERGAKWPRGKSNRAGFFLPIRP